VSPSLSLNGRNRFQSGGLWLGLLVALLLIFGPKWGWSLDPKQPLLNPMAAVLAIMAIWWITEAIPIAVTSLLPLVMFPVLGIPPGSLAAHEYGNPLIFLFLGGFLIALAIEDSGLHRRAALRIILTVGDNPRGLVLGFMLAGGLLSMWLSNTATTIMLLPIALNVLEQADATNLSPETKRRFGVSLMLTLAYSSSIGGMATLVGTPPNLIFKGYFEKAYPNDPPIGFVEWMVRALPLSLVFLVITWWLLTRVLFRLEAKSFFGGRDVVREQLVKLGPMRVVEWRMLLIFATTALLWIFREPTPGYGWGPLLGWGDANKTPDSKSVDEGTVAIAMAMLCFLIPRGGAEGRRPILEWSAAARVPWGILLLFGGGLALGAGMKSTGLDLFLGTKLASGLVGLGYMGILFVTATATTFFSEVTSNVACINMVLPILNGLCEDLSLNPRLLMMAATIAASCGFMLPIATPPNAIAYGAGRMHMWDMVKAGFWMNWIGIALVVLFYGLG
jgi:solute carrier family 13 (sodium-dependent dicarboxylate transporter), member 2/3/5